MIGSDEDRPVIEKLSPVDGRLVGTVQCVLPDEVPALVERARRAQAKWAKVPTRARGKYILRLSEIIADRAEELATAIAAETGKPVFEALTHEVMPIADLAHYFGKHSHEILARRPIALHLLKHRRSYLHFVPRGVIGVISPWNFPFGIPSGDVIMAIAAGNGVVLKPSELTPLIAQKLKELVVAAGIDADLMQVAVGYGDVGAALVKAGINMLHFTGSVPTGKKVAAACGERLIPCVMELGGKDAAIVLDDADLDHAARVIVHGAFTNSGQVCASIERVYAVAAIYEPLLERMAALAKGLRQGDGLKDDIDLGPMITPSQLAVVKGHVEQARARGATVRLGGNAHGSQYFEPTLLTEVTDDMAICAEESFGPLLPVMRVADADEAIARANRSRYGLSAYVFTRNTRRGREVAERLEAGTVDVNDALLTHAMPETPWGGVKDSGIGHTHSDDGLRHMCEARHVNYSVLPPFVFPWVFPYDPQTRSAFVALTQGMWGSGSLLARVAALWKAARGLVRSQRTHGGRVSP
jgi:acyl-CoA reductase-like NAD-dependent aldehyde dehydrogenase